MRKKFRSFCIWIGVLLSCYMLFNLIIWKAVTEDLLTDTHCQGGDLARMGYVSWAKICRQNLDSLPRRHLEAADFKGGPVDVITIGDSFSNGGGGGQNRYYQDYIASLQGLNVLNIPQYKDLDKISTLSILNNNGYLDRLKPKFILLEYAEKMCLHDFPEQIDFQRSLSEAELKQHQIVKYNADPESEQRSRQFKLDFFSEANVKFIRNSLLYRFSDNAYGSTVYQARLNRPFFTTSRPDMLLFYRSDIKDRQKYTAENIARLNDSLNTLSRRLKAKGIKLYFMPCVDKYNLYSEYIVNNHFPRSTFFETFRKLPHEFGFIDTKEILGRELSRGEMDVYYADDTHWSWKAAKRIFETVTIR